MRLLPHMCICAHAHAVMCACDSVLCNTMSAAQVVTMISVTDLLEDKGTVKALGVGKKAVMCRCWKSGTFPLCDASHVKHNKETGDNVGPLIIDNDTK